ncbi:MAG: RNA-guided endonuclease InsQ/TnpB family protein [Candidatus Thorarchaeota archaeon]
MTQSYPLKIPQTPELSSKLQLFQELTHQVSQELLELLWAEPWLDALATSSLKAYKVIDEKTVLQTSRGQQVYLPSRIRRGIAEQVGRILRSQAKRRDCYNDVLQVVQDTGVEGNLDNLVKIVAVTLIQFFGKFYRRAMIRQHLRTLRRYYYRLRLDLAVLLKIPYTQLVKPTIKTFLFPYSADNGLQGQTIKIDWTTSRLQIALKLPTTGQPLTRKEWEWTPFTIPIPPKILGRIPAVVSKVHLPNLRMLTLKGGLCLPFLEFPWSYTIDEPPALFKERVLATDLGVINLTTSVICEAGSQISPPRFWSPSSQLLHKIDQLYHHIARLQKKFANYPSNWAGQRKRQQEQERLYRKLNRYRKEILHLTSNFLVETALVHKCREIVLEDLRNYEPPKNQRTLSRKLSNWLRGALFELVSYKAQKAGIRVKRVNPHWTSTYCPRCGLKGQKITEPIAKIAERTGRFFSCGHCGFTADRDYIGALNIYRMSQAQRKKRYSLKCAKPVSYKGTGIPLNCPSGASAHLTVNG